MFSKRRVSAEDTLLLAIVRAKEWQRAQTPQIQTKPTQRNPIIPPRHPPTWRCHTDAAWKDKSTAGLGWIFTDQFQTVLRQGSYPVDKVCSPLMAEALATLTAMEVAIESGFHHTSFASDSQVLVKAINRKIFPKELHGILFDILSLSLKFTSISFFFVSRSQNQLADALAKSALFISCIVP